jgi:hypothetical protein
MNCGAPASAASGFRLPGGVASLTWLDPPRWLTRSWLLGFVETGIENFVDEQLQGCCHRDGD